MSIRSRVMDWLGISELRDKLDELNNQLLNSRAEFNAAIYDEDDPRRRELSNEIGRRAIKRLKAEDKARRHTLGEL